MGWYGRANLSYWGVLSSVSSPSLSLQPPPPKTLVAEGERSFASSHHIPAIFITNSTVSISSLIVFVPQLTISRQCCSHRPNRNRPHIRLSPQLKSKFPSVAEFLPSISRISATRIYNINQRSVLHSTDTHVIL